MHNNIIFIGLPGSGKSTLGVLLAKHLRLDFIDTDILIQSQQQQTLQAILNQEGYLKLREIEEQVLLGLDRENTLISTGGSAVYSESAMLHLKQLGTIVYLEVDLEIIKNRINNEDTRGIAKPPEQSLEQVLLERLPLYEKYADIIWNNNVFRDVTLLEDEILKYNNT